MGTCSSPPEPVCFDDGIRDNEEACGATDVRQAVAMHCVGLGRSKNGGFSAPFSKKKLANGG